MRRQTFDARLRPFGITAVQYWVLGRLARTNDSGLTQTELARALESGKVSVGALVTRLEALGLVERRDDSRDRRIRRIFLTDTGYVAIDPIAAVPHRDRKRTRLTSNHYCASRMPYSARNNNYNRTKFSLLHLIKHQI